MLGPKKTILGYNTVGFTTLELIIAITLVGVMAMIVISNFGHQSKLSARRTEFLANLNLFLANARYDTLVSGKLHKILLDLNKQQFSAHISTGTKDSQGELKFVSAPVENCPWSQKFEPTAIYINTKNMLHAFEGGSEQVWFYLTPDGLSQNVIINFSDLDEVGQLGSGGEYSLVLNPFSVQFELYETFQQPA